MKDAEKRLTCKTNLRTLTAPEKLDIIDSHFKSGEDYEFPRTDMNKCNRAFRHQWLTTYNIYSKEVDGGFCLPCVLFATKEKIGVLVNTPFRRWTKVSDICGQHQQKTFHSDVQLKYDKFVTNQREPEKNIESQISVQKVIVCSGLTSLSTILQSYHDGVWLRQGALTFTALPH